ncbi:MAG: response regulator [Treponema sp.]|jgi:CheY-like chemotaxis protein|nr:response regulator [Treponema sp.]
MISKEQLLEIPELEISGIIEEIDLRQYNQSLEKFVNHYNKLDSAMDSAMEAKDTESLSKVMVVIRDMLTDIHAQKLADEVQKYLFKLGRINPSGFDIDMTDLLSSLFTLSIDILMAQYKTTASADNKNSALNMTNLEMVDILAVDDAPVFLRSFKSILRGSKYKVACVTSGQHALNFLHTHTAKLFVLDIMMPKMDGYELAKKIKEAGHNAPVIFLTGLSQQEFVKRAMDIGAVDFIVKPFNAANVLARIKKQIQ